MWHDLRYHFSWVGDTTSPGDVTGLDGVSGLGQISLAWTNPADSDFVGVMIRYRIDTYPRNTADGLPIPNGNDGKIAGSPGLSMSYVHTNLDSTKSYHYSAFSYDRSNNYSHTAHAFGQPLSLSNQPPVIPPQSFTATPSSLNNPGKTTTFNVSAADPNDDTLTYTINFGDSAASGSGSQVMHTYAAPGTYTATVTVNDGNGNTAGQSLQVTVNDLPPAKPKNVSAN